MLLKSSISFWTSIESQIFSDTARFGGSTSRTRTSATNTDPTLCSCRKEKKSIFILSFRRFRLKQHKTATAIFIYVYENCLLSVEEIKVYVALLVPDAFVLFVKTVARTRTVGQVAYGVLRRTLAVVQQRCRFLGYVHWVGVTTAIAVNHHC